jgi:hypothetical protein
MIMTTFWDTTPRSSVEVDRHFMAITLINFILLCALFNDALSVP